MTFEDRTCVIVNPRSGGGATDDKRDEIRTEALAAFRDPELRFTERPGHATELAAAAAEQGFGRVIAVGGDGTASEVVNGLFDGDRNRRPDLIFGVVNSGTGGDLVKTLKTPVGYGPAMRWLASAAGTPTDVVSARFRDADGQPVHRLCINVMGFGMQGDVVARANRSSKQWGGRLTFLRAGVASYRRYERVPAEIAWVDAAGREGRWSGSLLSAFVANAAFCGGGLWVGKGGSMRDGLLDVTIVPDLSLRRSILGSLRLLTGDLGSVKEVLRIQARSLRAFAESDNLVPVDVDGEQPGQLPLEVRVLEKALLVAGLTGGA